MTVPGPELDDRVFTPTRVREWQEWYGFDFSPLVEVNPFSNLLDLTSPHTMREWKVLADPILLTEVDFRSWSRPFISTRETFTARASGCLNGLLVYFDLLMGERVFLSTHPDVVREDNSWHTPVYMFSDGGSLEAGDRCGLVYTGTTWPAESQPVGPRSGHVTDPDSK